jgi:diacylglycerol kinase family enzyme
VEGTHESTVAAPDHARLAAAASLALLAVAAVVALIAAAEHFPDGVAVLVCLLLGIGVAGWGIVRSGAARVGAVLFGALALAAAIALVVVEQRVLEGAIVVVCVLLALEAARRAFAPHAVLPAGPHPHTPVLFYNPKSGGGKAERFHVAAEAAHRGVEAIELKLGDDLEQLAHDAAARGADALGVAGGDGSQAIVAAVAADHGLPFVCVPAGTRNHFALDLGVDRDDVVGALDAYVRGRERVVDLAEVNGKVFVNNVSLGVYAEAVQREEYRDAKLRTLAATAPTLLGPAGHRLDLEWTDEDGDAHRSADVILVSNDPYRLGRALASGTRPRLDRGVLGVAAAADDGNGGHLRTWSAPAFEVGSKLPIAAGIDGEAVTLDPPLRFRTRPRALRVLLAPQHPGASPSALVPQDTLAALRGLAHLAVRGAR